MNWWFFHSSVSFVQYPDSLRRYCGERFSFDDVVSRLASVSEMIRVRNLLLAIPRKASVEFCVVGAPILVEVSELQDCVVIEVKNTNLNTLDRRALPTARWIEKLLDGVDAVAPPGGAHHLEKIDNGLLDGSYTLGPDNSSLVLLNVDVFCDLSAESLTIDLLRSQYAYQGVTYFQGAVRLQLDSSLIEHEHKPWHGWGGGGALEEGVYLVRWLKYPYNGGQQLTGGFTDCILARIPTPLSEKGLERSPYVWGEWVEVKRLPPLLLDSDDDDIQEPHGGIIAWLKQGILKLLSR